MWTQATLPKKVEWLGKVANRAKKKEEEKNMRKKITSKNNKRRRARGVGLKINCGCTVVQQSNFN